jgi:hypothetical protein
MFSERNAHTKWQLVEGLFVRRSCSDVFERMHIRNEQLVDGFVCAPGLAAMVPYEYERSWSRFRMCAGLAAMVSERKAHTK